jgi:hypothetical protein
MLCGRCRSGGCSSAALISVARARPIDEPAAKLVLRTLARRIEAGRRDRRLVTHRPRPLRSRFRTTRRRRACPRIERSNVRHRLNRGGDRQLNHALHTIVLHRRQHDAATRAYVERRVAEGKSRREATRLLKRYFARLLFRLLQQAEPLMT